MIQRLIVSAVVAFGLAGCSIFGGEDEIDLTAPAELLDIQPQFSVSREWSLSVGGKIGEWNDVLDPVVVDGIIYTASVDGRVFAVNASTGARVWSTEISGSEDITGATGFGDGQIYVGTEAGRVYALDQQTGAEHWYSQIGSEIVSAPMSGQGVVVVHAQDGRVHGLEATNGEGVWIIDGFAPALSLRGNATPLIVNEVAVVANDSGKVATYRLSDGAIFWQARVAVPEGRTELERLVDIDGSPIFYDGQVFAGSYQGGISAINPGTGRPVWYQPTSTTESLAANSGTVALASTTGDVELYNANSGELIWKNSDLAYRVLSAPAVSAQFVAVADFEGYLHILNRRTGTMAGRTRIDRDPVRTRLLNVDDHIIVLDSSGKLHSYSVSEIE